MTGQVGRAQGGQGGVAVPAIAVVLAAVLLAAVALAALRSDTAGAPTVLLEGAAVSAASPDGTRRVLAVGDEVPQGSTVAAGADGAVLRTRDRDVHLGSNTELTVVDGARQVLAAGLVMVDARRGPGVEIETPAAVVTTPDGAVSRVEGGALLRVATFAGDSVRVRPAGRRAATELSRWTQTQVPIGGLPGRTTALQLTGDPYERRLAPDLVADDRALNDLGRTLDNGGAQGPAVLAALEAALPGAAAATVVPVIAFGGESGAGGAGAGPAVGPTSERALAFLLAAAAEGRSDTAPQAPGGLAERFTEVRALRADGGSWGPIARLAEAPVPAVSRLLDDLLTPLVLVAGELPGPIDLAALLSPSTAVAPPPAAAGSPDGSAPGGTASPGGGSPPPDDQPPPADDQPPPADDQPPPADDQPPPPDDDPPLPTPPLPPVPPPADGPVGTVTDAVDAVVDTVIGLLPDLPVPTPTPTLPPPPPLPDLPGVDALEPPLR